MCLCVCVCVCVCMSFVMNGIPKKKREFRYNSVQSAKTKAVGGIWRKGKQPSWYFSARF